MATIFMKRAEEPRAEVDGKPMEPGPTPNQKRSEQFVDDAISWARRTRAFPLQEFQSMQRFAQELDSVALPPGALCNFGAKIGQGAFGMIRRAELDGRVVAVKNLEGSRSDGPVNDIMYKARNELEILREVHHPNIVAFLGTSASFPAATQPVGAWKIAFVMELCERGDLNQLMHKDKVPFSFSEKVSMARDTACALAYLHKHKIFHRDLCSRNLLLMTDGRVKICDFGCARIMKRFSFQPNFILGSVSWMSPEQVKGKPIGMQSDLYSFGMIMWELATEMQPFNNCEGLNFAQLQDVVAMGPPPIPPKAFSGLDKEMAEAFHSLIKLSLVKEPELRAPIDQVWQVLAAIDKLMKNSSSVIESQINGVALSSNSSIDEDKNASEASTDEASGSRDTTPPSSSGGSPTPESVNYQATVRQLHRRLDLGIALKAFYCKYNPAKTSQEVVNVVLNKYANNEDELNTVLQQRYKSDLNDFTKPKAKPIPPSPSKFTPEKATANKDPKGNSVSECIQSKQPDPINVSQGRVQMRLMPRNDDGKEQHAVKAEIDTSGDDLLTAGFDALTKIFDDSLQYKKTPAEQRPAEKPDPETEKKPSSEPEARVKTATPRDRKAPVPAIPDAKAKAAAPILLSKMGNILYPEHLVNGMRKKSPVTPQSKPVAPPSKQLGFSPTKIHTSGDDHLTAPFGSVSNICTGNLQCEKKAAEQRPSKEPDPEQKPSSEPEAKAKAATQISLSTNGNILYPEHLWRSRSRDHRRRE